MVTIVSLVGLKNASTRCDTRNLSVGPALSYYSVTMELRALVVCPDQDSIDLLALIQSEMGMKAEHTSSISRGLDLLNTQHFDAIVIDYRADESAEEFLARMRRSAKNRDSLLIAVVDSEFNARLVFVLGASFVLFRPLSSERTRVSLRAARSLMRRERRRSPRTPVGSSAKVAYPGAPELKAVLADISEGGTAIQTANHIPATSKVYFEFALPGQPQLVRLSGEVAWQDSSGRTGIRFLDVPQTSRRLMQTWLEQNLEQTASGMPEAAPAEQPLEQPAATTSRPEKKHTSKSAALVSNAGNRRGEQRFACRVGADVYSAGTNVPNRATLSDISEGGCYVEMPSPIDGQSGVEILVRTADTKFKIKGEVLTTHPGFGMGVRFLLRDSAQREEIMRLLGVVATGPSIEE
jgi:c-di-GMP-binding flagellar brake protein YcgR